MRYAVIIVAAISSLLLHETTQSGLFWTWGPGGGIGKSSPKKEHKALWVHPVYAGQSFTEFGGPPLGIPVYRNYLLKILEPTKKPQYETVTHDYREFEFPAGSYRKRK